MANLKKGSNYKKAVSALQQIINEDIAISNNEFIKDHNGVPREFDIVIRTQIGPYQTMGVIECKDHSRKVSLGIIDEFATKSKSVNAHLKIIFSNSGFTKNAIESAKSHGIYTYSLIDSGNESLKLRPSMFVYAPTHRYTILKTKIETKREELIPQKIGNLDLFFRKHSIADLSIKEILSNAEKCDPLPGLYTIKVTARDKETRFITILGKRFSLVELE